MVTGVGVKANAEGAEPMVNIVIVHSAIAAEKSLLCRIISIFCRSSVFIFLIFLSFLCLLFWPSLTSHRAAFVPHSRAPACQGELSSSRSPMYCAKLRLLLREESLTRRHRGLRGCHGLSTRAGAQVLG